MDKKHIEELYYLYREQMYHKTAEMSDISKEISTNYDKLCTTITEDEKKIINEIMELDSKRGGLIEIQVFVFAFSLATQLLTEGLNKDE